MAKEHRNLMEVKIVSELCASEGIVSNMLLVYLFMLPWNVSSLPFVLSLFFFFQLVCTGSFLWPSLPCSTKDFFFFPSRMEGQKKRQCTTGNEWLRSSMCHSDRKGWAIVSWENASLEFVEFNKHKGDNIPSNFQSQTFIKYRLTWKKCRMWTRV